MYQNKLSLKLPGASKVRNKQSGEIDYGGYNPYDEASSAPTTILNQKDLETILKKQQGSTFIDLSASQYNLESDEFLLYCPPNAVKELDLSFNSLMQLSSLKNLSKLKRLYADNNLIVSIPFHGLSSLVLLSVTNNRLTHLEDMSDLKKLVHLDLCGNRIVTGFEELAKLKALKVLDLANNMLDMPIQNFTAIVLDPLKRLPKLEYLSFLDNPVETKIPEFRHFVIQELPRLKYLDWLPITKEEKTRAAKLESEGIWAGKSQPIKETGSPRTREAAANSALTRHSVSYDVDFSKQFKSTPAATSSSGTGSVRGVPQQQQQPPPPPPQQQPVFPTPVTPPQSRHAPPISRESSQFNGDFSALDAMIEEFEGASNSFLLSASGSTGSSINSSNHSQLHHNASSNNNHHHPPPHHPAAHNQTHFTSFEVSSSPSSSTLFELNQAARIASNDPLAELLNEFEAITPTISRRSMVGNDDYDPPKTGTPASIPPGYLSSPSEIQYESALSRTDVSYPDSSFERYPEDGQILSNIDKILVDADAPKKSKFADNVDRNNEFQDANFADELEAALSELEASLDFSAVESSLASEPAAPPPQNLTEFNLSQIESTLQELSGAASIPSTPSTPSKHDLDRSFSAPPPPSVARTSSNSSLLDRSFSSNSLRVGTPSSPKAKQAPRAPAPPSTAAPLSPKLPPNKTPPPVHKTSPTLKPSPAPSPAQSPSSSLSPVPAAASPAAAASPSPAAAAAAPATPTSPATPLQERSVAPPSPTPARPSSSHSFAGSFEPPSKRSSTSSVGSAPPDSPKIRSKLSHSYIPPLEEDLSEQRQEPEPAPAPAPDDDDVLDKLINSLAMEVDVPLVPEEPQQPTMLRARRPLSAVFVPPASHPALATLPSPAQLPQSIIKSQEIAQQQQQELQRQLHQHQLQQQMQQLQEQHEQQQQLLQQQLQQQQQQLEQLQHQQRKQQEERDREAQLQRDQLSQRELLYQRELQQQKEREAQLQVELQKQKEAQQLAQAHQQLQLQQQMQQQALLQQQQQAEMLLKRQQDEILLKKQQEEEQQRLLHQTAQIIPWSNLTVGAKLGGGAFGEVSAGTMKFPPAAKLPPKDVTIKKIRMQRFADNFLDLFKGCVQSFSVLPPHPNILPLVGGCIEVTICTVHDFVDGISLAETKGVLELGNSLTLQIARSIAAGLQALHKHGLMHRSLKPTNVMLANPDAQTPIRTVKLRDYGFAPIKDAILKAGQAPNPYLAPEIILNPQLPYTQSIDVFALGMTLWYLFSGEQPFPGLHPKKMAEAMASGIRPNLPPHTPAPFVKLIQACWNSEPTARPPIDTVAKILSMSETKLFGAPAPITNPPTEPQPPPAHQPPQLPPRSAPPSTSTSSLSSSSSSSSPPSSIISSSVAGQGSRVNIVLAKVVDTLVQRSANQIPKACKLLEVLNQPDAIPVMLEKGIPNYLVDMLKIPYADSADVEAVLRTLQLLAGHESFAQTLATPMLLTPILALVAPHTAPSSSHTYVLPAGKVISALLTHPSLLTILRDHGEMEALIAFTEALRKSTSHTKDDEVVMVLGILSQLLTTWKARNYFLTTGGLDATLFHANAQHPPLRFRVVEMLYLFTVDPTPSSPTSPPANVVQDAFARNAASITHLASILNSSDSLQVRLQTAKILLALSHMDWKVPNARPSSGSSIISGSGASRANYPAVTAALHSTVPKLIAAMSSCRPTDGDDLLISICLALSIILNNSDPNSSSAISKLDQLAVFAQLQNIPQSSAALLPVLQVAHHIVKVRQDLQNLEGEMAMCIPQIIAISGSPLNPEAQKLALDFIVHISGAGQHAAALVDAGVVQSLVNLLGQQVQQPPKPLHSTSASLPLLALQVISSLLTTTRDVAPDVFARVCESVVACGGVGVVTQYAAVGGNNFRNSLDASEQVLASELAVTILSELSRNGGGRESIITFNGLHSLASVGVQDRHPSEKTVESVLSAIAMYCGSVHYYSALRESRAIRTVAQYILSEDNVFVSLALKSVLQLAKEATGREILGEAGAASQLAVLARSTNAENPTLPIAAQKVLALLHANGIS